MTVGALLIHFPRFSSSPLISWHYTWLMNPPFGWCLLLGACQNPCRLHSCWQQYQFFSPYLNFIPTRHLPAKAHFWRSQEAALCISLHKNPQNQFKHEQKEYIYSLSCLNLKYQILISSTEQHRWKHESSKLPPLLWVSRQPQPFNVFFIVKQYLMFHYGPSSLGLACLDTAVMLSGLMKWAWTYKEHHNALSFSLCVPICCS